ncbi:MAG: hypothetical protein IBX55_01950 [Methyloprofundus sp.]|nr:hypothetical protein [Methyloprofundus sp.]
MRKKLLSSVTFIVAFWWVTFYFYWYLGIESVKDVFQEIFSFASMPSLREAWLPIEISFLYWVIPILGIVAAAIFFGIIISLAIAVIPKVISEEKLSRKVSWRGVGISLGDLPLPEWKIHLEKYMAEGIDKFIDEKGNTGKENEAKKVTFSTKHKKLLTDILFYIWANKNSAYAGAGHGVDLYRHTISVLDQAWSPGCDPLIPIAAAAHDAGKVMTFKKNPDTNDWEAKGFHDDFGMLLVATMDSFEELDEDEKLILKIVIGYGHKEHKRPVLENNIEQRVQEIFSVINKSDREQTAREKKEVLKSTTPQIITEAFLKALTNAPFQTQNTKRGAESICFRREDIVYLLEPGFRDLFLNKLPDDVAAAYGEGFRRIGNMSPPTVALINHLKNLGWLVEEGNGMTSECGLWSVEIGKKVFNGVLAVRLPENIIKSLPGDSVYEVRFSCPLKVGPKTVLKPKDRLSSEQMDSIQKKARQLHALTGKSMDSLVELLKKEAEQEMMGSEEKS